MKKWTMLLALAAIALLAPPAEVNAQDGASLSITASADKASASVGDNINYTYLVSNAGNVTVDNLTLQDSKLGAVSLGITALAPGAIVNNTATYTVLESDLPGPLVTTATITGTEPSGQIITATSNPVSVALSASSDNGSNGGQPPVLTRAQILKALGVPGKGIAKAPGLQKPFNPNSQAARKLERLQEQLRIKHKLKHQLQP